MPSEKSKPKVIGPKVDITDDDYTFSCDQPHKDCEAAKVGDQLHHIISDEEFCAMKRVGENAKTHPQTDEWRKLATKHLGSKGLNGTLSLFTVHACNLIDSQVEEIKRSDALAEYISGELTTRDEQLKAKDEEISELHETIAELNAT